MKKFLIAILIIILASGGIFFFLRTRDSGEISKKYEGFNFISEGKDIDKKDFARIDKQFYVSYDYIKSEIDPEIRYDDADNTVIIANKKGTKYIPLDSKEATFNGEKIELRDPAVKKDGKIMLPIESFIYDYDINIRYNDKQLLILDKTDREYAIGKPKDGAIIREKASNQSPIIKKLKADEEVYVYSEEGDFYRVREKDGFAGYIKKSQIEVEFANKFINQKEEKREALAPLNLTWDYTYAKQSKDSIAKIKDIYGLNVICPTWFSITKTGDIIDRADIEYVDKYRSLGIDVWAYLDNGFNKEITHESLKSAKIREKIITNMLHLCDRYKLGGINIDFEHTDIEDRDLITQFTKECYYAFKTKNKMVSIDVTPQIYSDVKKEPYDRKELAKFSDYVIVMAYDQHWSSSQKAGSVAQYKWVEGSINVLFKNIPTDKMVLGIPLYTRLWVEESGKVKSNTISMDQVNKLIQEKNLKPKFDEESKQNYIEYNLAGKNYKVWIEDAQSIRHKASLVNKYKLAGIASWRKGFETEDIWKVIKEEIDFVNNKN